MSIYHHIPRFLFSVLLLLLCADSSNGCIEEDRQALLNLKRNLNTEDLFWFTTWEGTNCCTWRGVVCDGAIGHVVALSYIGYSDSGFPQQAHVKPISNLTSLRNLTLVKLHFYEARNLFQVLSMLPSLSVLNLSRCIIDDIHFSLAQINSTTFLSRIQLLDFSYNYFQGTFPSFLQNMISLRYLDLSSNFFQVPFPSSLQNMISLTYLDLSYNSLTSSVPYWLGNLKNLQHLILSSNSFDIIVGGISTILWNQCSLKSLDLSYNNLNNEVLETYGNVSGCVGYELETLDLSFNNFKGQIPDWLMSLKNLTRLSLTPGNSFYGPIPASIQSLSKLEVLDLSQDEVSENVSELYLDRTSFYGPIPTSLGKLTRLTWLSLANNKLSGVVPDSLGQLVDLEYLDLSSNSLEGFLTEIHLTNLSKLKTFRLDSNHLAFKVKYGWVPSFQLEEISMRSCKSLTEFPQWIKSQVNLKYLDLSTCNISGPIPDWLVSLENLTHLDLQHNSLHGPIPTSLGKLSRLKELILGKNQLSGYVPGSLGQLIDLRILDLSFNSLEGFLTEVHLTNLSMMSQFSVNSNNLTVKVKRAWVTSFQPQTIAMGSCKSLTEFPPWLETQNPSTLDLSNCSISEPIPIWVHNWYGIVDLRLSHNLINGSIPSILCNMTMLQFLDLSGNLLSGDIPNCWHDNHVLYTIKLSSNNLTGFVPSSLGHIYGLSSLHLNNNSLEGEFPSSLRKCTGLVVLDLGQNGFNGNIPAWIGTSLLQLTILRLRDNSFDGDIPPQLCQLPLLKILDIAENNLLNTIPHCLGNLSGMISSKYTSMYYFELSLETVSMVFQGRVIEYTTVLRFLVTMDLSNNNLDGIIPEELTNLNGVHSLNLSYNHLMGNIPKNIGNMTSLASLDFSRNQLSGSIPTSLSNLYSLSYLNLSYNNFSGQIPTGHQLQTLNNASIYTGNPKLCGAPILRKCTADKLPSDDQDNDIDDKFDNMWFYLAVTLGYATGVWGVIAVLIFKKTWRYAYFRFADDTIESTYVAVAVNMAYLKRKIGLNHVTS